MSIDIKQLSDIIKNSLPIKSIQLEAEVRQPKMRGGHIYLNLADKTGIVNSVIFSNSVTEEIANMVDGDMVTVVGKLNYYQGNGILNFIINKLITKNGEGELHIKYKKTMAKFKSLGYFEDEIKLKLPKVIKKILILTSKSGAAIQDFYHTLEAGKCKVNHKLIDVIVQGNDCPKTICQILENPNIYENNYDMIVITRGGGSFEDLFGFCRGELIEAVHNCKIPILSAVGHQVDTTLLDYVADYVASTPTMAAQFIVDYNRKYVDTLQSKNNIMKDKLTKYLHNMLSSLNHYKMKINNNKYFFENIKSDLKNNIIKKLNNDLLLLEKYKAKYTIPNNIMISTSKKNNIDTIDDFNMILNKNKKFIIQWGDTIIKVKSYEVLN